MKGCSVPSQQSCAPVGGEIDQSVCKNAEAVEEGPSLCAVYTPQHEQRRA